MSSYFIKPNNNKIAIIGAGIFGASIALKLADNGFSVDLFEKNHDILYGASCGGINKTYNRLTNGSQINAVNDDILNKNDFYYYRKTNDKAFILI